MAVDVSKIPNNNKFDPVREAILKLQSDIQSGVSGVGSINNQTGLITITKSGNITVGTSGTTITIGIDDSTYLTEEVNDLTAAVTWANVPDANITQSSVTQHQASLSITESQISDLQSYLVASDLDDYLLLTETGEQTISGDIVISGDLTVSGETTYINTNHLNIGDNIIQLNADIGGTTAPTEDAGFYVNRGSQPDASFLWDEDTDRFSTYANGLSTANLYIGSNQVINSSRQFIGSSTISSTVPYFTFSGDLNTGVGRATNNKVSLIAEGTKVLEASNTGVEITGDLEVSGTFTADSVTFPNDIITSADFSATDNRFKLTLTQSDSDTIEASFDDVVLSSAMDANYVPYVTTAGGDGSSTNTNAILGESWLKINSNTLELDWTISGSPGYYQERNIKMRKQGSFVNQYKEATYDATSITFTDYVSASDIDTAKISGTNAGRIRINDTYSFPASDGTSGQVLTTDGTGDLSWVAAGGSLDLDDVTTNGAITTNDISTGRITIANNVSTGGFGSFDDYQLLLYEDTTASTSYGLGIESGTMMFHSNDEYRFYVNNSVKVTINSSGNVSANSFSGGNITSTETITGDTIKLTSDASDTSRHRIAVYDEDTVSYGMMLWNTNAASGEWATMIYGPKQSNRRISFGKVSGTTFSNHADVTEIAHFDLDNSRLYVDGGVVAGNDGAADWGNALIDTSLSAGWGTTTEFPFIGSVGGTVGSIIMLHNPHIPYRTDNALSGYDGRAGLRLARNADGDYWDAGLAGDFFHIYRSGTGEFLRIDNTGLTTFQNVVRLVGTTSGTSQIDLPLDYGALRWYDGTTFKAGIGAASWSGLGSGNDIGFYLNSGDLHIGNQSSPFVTFDRADESLGVGKTSPQAKLHISHGDSNNGLLLENTLQASDFQYLLNIRETEGLIFQRWTNGAYTSNVMTLSYDDKVGIGNTTPSTALEVTGAGALNSYRGVIRIENTSTAQWAGLAFPDDVNGTDSASNNYYFIGRGGAIGDRTMSFHIPTAADYTSGAEPYFRFSSTGADDLMTIEATSGDTFIKGDLGIGTAPSDKLHVVGNTKFDGNVVIDTDTGANALYITRSGATNQSMKIYTDDVLCYFVAEQDENAGSYGSIQMALDAGGTDNSFTITDGVNGTSLFQVKNNGNGGFYNSGSFAIGKSSTTYGTLDVEGAGSFKEDVRIYTSTTTNQGGITMYDTDGDGYLSIAVTDNEHPSGWGWQFQSNFANSATGTVYFRIGYDGADSYLNSGNFGIGTTTPAQKLQVVGDIRMGNSGVASVLRINRPSDGADAGQVGYFSSTSNTPFGISNGSGGGDIELRSNNGSLRFYTGVSQTDQVFRIANNGNVGIGTTSPFTKTHIYDTFDPDDTYGYLLVENGNTSSGSPATNAAVNVKNYHGTSQFMQWEGNGLRFGSRITANGGAGNVYITSGNDSVAMTLLSGGNVGINTTSPSYKLHVNASSIQPTADLLMGEVAYSSSNSYVGLKTTNMSGANDYMILSGKTDGNTFISAKDGAYVAVRGGGNWSNNQIQVFDNDYVTTSGGHRFGTGGTPNWGNAIVDTGSGAGWGSGNYPYIGSVNGSSGSLIMLHNIHVPMRTDNKADSSYAGRAGMRCARDTNASGWWDIGLAGDFFQLFRSSTGELFRVTNNGTVHADNDIIAFSATTSDKRLKDDIKTIDNALDKVMNLRGVSYTWNNGSRKGQKDLGVIAQEVEQVIPEIVREHELPLMDDSGEKYKTVDYEKMVGVLIEAMKEQQKQIDELKARLDGSTN